MRSSTNKARINEWKARYMSASEHVERLTPSLLAKAFRGKLVEQNLNDELASVLLEKIDVNRNRGNRKRLYQGRRIA